MEFVAFMAGVSFFGMPWVAWWIGSRRKYRVELKKLEVERERELTRRRYMELDYELRQRQLTERIYDESLTEHPDGRRAQPQPPRVPGQVPGQVPGPGSEPNSQTAPPQVPPRGTSRPAG